MIHPSRQRNALLPLIAGAGAFVLCLVAFELAQLASYRLNFSSPLPYGLRADEDRLAYVRLTPNFEGRSAAGIVYRTNELGFRSEPILKNAPYALFLGDSTTFGLGLGQNETYPSRFASALQAMGKRSRVLNAATPGQGTLDQIAILKELLDGGDIDVRLVVVGFFPNDLSNNLEVEAARASQMRASHDLSWKQRLDKAMKRFRAWTYMVGRYFQLKERIASGQPAQSPGTALQGGAGQSRAEGGEAAAKRPDRALLNDRLEFPARPGREIEWNLLEPDELEGNRAYISLIGAINELAAICAEKRISWAILYLPDDDRELTGEIAQPLYLNRLRDEVVRLGGRFENAVDIYRGAMKEDSRLEEFRKSGLTGGHPSKRASELLGKELAKRLAEDIGD